MNYKNTKRNGKCIRTHRFVMEQHLGRKLFPWEAVHHKNGDKHDNRLDNLDLMTRKSHSRLHPPPSNRISDFDLISELNRIKAEFGKVTVRLFDKYSKYSSKTLYNHGLSTRNECPLRLP